MPKKQKAPEVAPVVTVGENPIVPKVAETAPTPAPEVTSVAPGFPKSQVTLGGSQRVDN